MMMDFEELVAIGATLSGIIFLQFGVYRGACKHPKCFR